MQLKLRLKNSLCKYFFYYFKKIYVIHTLCFAYVIGILRYVIKTIAPYLLYFIHINIIYFKWLKFELVFFSNLEKLSPSQFIVALIPLSLLTVVLWTVKKNIINGAIWTDFHYE
jgi:hypothetical protein